jgi:hypothetical protein
VALGKGKQRDPVTVGHHDHDADKEWRDVIDVGEEVQEAVKPGLRGFTNAMVAGMGKRGACHGGGGSKHDAGEADGEGIFHDGMVLELARYSGRNTSSWFQKTSLAKLDDNRHCTTWTGNPPSFRKTMRNGASHA